MECTRGRIEFHLLHGHALLNPEYEALLNDTQFAAISEGAHSGGGEVVASTWFTGRKRGLLAPFAVGTVDQALLSGSWTRGISSSDYTDSLTRC